MGKPVSIAKLWEVLKLSVGAVEAPLFSATIDSPRSLAVRVVTPVGVKVEAPAREVLVTAAMSNGVVALTKRKAAIIAEAPPVSALTVTLGAVSPAWKNLLNTEMAMP